MQHRDGGIVTKLNVQEGQFVKAGDLLITLDSRTDEANVAKARAQLAKDNAALADAGLAPGEVDRIFLTGGSSLVPAVRDIFHRRFASDRIETGAELESIASGLALIGREPDVSRWTARD